MAKQVKVWVDEDGKHHTSQVKALEADVAIWKARARAAERKIEDKRGQTPPASTAG